MPPKILAAQAALQECVQPDESGHDDENDEQLANRLGHVDERTGESGRHATSVTDELG